MTAPREPETAPRTAAAIRSHDRGSGLNWHETQAIINALDACREAARSDAERRLREAEGRAETYRRLFIESFCALDRFETCGDPFCVDARNRRDAALDALLLAAPAPAGSDDD